MCLVNVFLNWWSWLISTLRLKLEVIYLSSFLFWTWGDFSIIYQRANYGRKQGFNAKYPDENENHNFLFFQGDSDSISPHPGVNLRQETIVVFSCSSRSLINSGPLWGIYWHKMILWYHVVCSWIKILC